MLVSGDVYHSPILFTWYAFPLWKLTLQVSRSTVPETFKEKSNIKTPQVLIFPDSGSEIWSRGLTVLQNLGSPMVDF